MYLKEIKFRATMKRILYCLCMGMMLAGVFSACSNDEDGAFSQADGQVMFQGMVEQGQTASRADEFELIGTSDARFGDIHICMGVDGEFESSVYTYAEGVLGRLAVQSGYNALNWHGETQEHDFYAWTRPAGINMSASSQLQTEGTVTFGREEETGLEDFIVARNEGITYETNSSYVELTFYRPVAKIQLDSLVHISADGTRTPLSSCTITFPNLYLTATFDAKRILSADEEPRDVWKTDEQQTQWQTGLEWRNDAVPNSEGNYEDVLYVYPFDFESVGTLGEEEQPGYFILTATVGSGSSSTEKTYRASLAGITSLTGLKAGEVLHLALQVADGAVAGFGSYIRGWNSEERENASHSRPGIYTQADAEALLQYLQDGDSSDLPVYFYEEENGVKVICLYTHLDWSTLTQELALPSDVRLEGQGYYIRFGTGGSLSGIFNDVYTPDGQPYTSAAEGAGS